MKCPIETRENAELLLEYCARKLDPETTAVLERHIAICPACREFAAGQRALWETLDTWDSMPVPAEFDRQLYSRIEREVGWWDLLVRPFRPLLVRRGLPVAAACLAVIAGVLLERPSAVPQPDLESSLPSSAQMETVQPEQVEQALDAMEMLSEFNQHVRGDNSRSRRID